MFSVVVLIIIYCGWGWEEVTMVSLSFATMAVRDDGIWVDTLKPS